MTKFVSGANIVAAVVSMFVWPTLIAIAALCNSSQNQFLMGIIGIFMMIAYFGNLMGIVTSIVLIVVKNRNWPTYFATMIHICMFLFVTFLFILGVAYGNNH